MAPYELRPRPAHGLCGVAAPRLGSAGSERGLTSLPQELLRLVLERLDDVQDLLRLSQASRFLETHVMANETAWEAAWELRFGAPPSRLHRAARALAGSWMRLLRDKAMTDKAHAPWRKPTEWELRAALRELAGDSGGSAQAAISDSGSVASASVLSSVESSAASVLSGSEAAAPATAPSPPPPGEEEVSLAVVFLVDGSGSVGEEDFACMTQFLQTAAEAVAAVQGSKVGVVQFSNDVRVEVPLGPLDSAAFAAGIKGMVRLNGGTNIAAAVAKAGALLKAAPGFTAATRRVLALLTDGRIDGFQAREAGQMVARLADEQQNLALWAFGVGRGVDAQELIRIIEGGAAAGGAGRERYVELCVRDDAPW